MTPLLLRGGTLEVLDDDFGEDLATVPLPLTEDDVIPGDL